MEHVETHFIGKVAQKAIIENSGKVLVCKGLQDSVWEFPGGRLNDNESPQDGLSREIVEELGVPVTIHGPVHVCRSYHTKSNTWNIFIAYHCSIEKPGIEKANLEEIEDVQWVSFEELKNLPMFSDCRKAADVFLQTHSA